MTSPIRYWNRAKNQLETEQVYGEALVGWLYGTTPGQLLADHVLSAPWFSKLYGEYQSLPLSARKIQPFIRDFSIPMAEFEPGPFKNFNEFFIRKFRPGARQFVADPGRMPACAEARYFAYSETAKDQDFPIKGSRLTAQQLLRQKEWVETFAGGPLLIARLCPVDYHRFHFPDDGRVLAHYPIHGDLHSVNPSALRYRADILATNERQISILETKSFGKLAYIEVGAICVGKIVQTHSFEREFSRGDEKGYFLFGGSTVVVMGEPGRWIPSQDILDRTAEGIESYAKLGEEIASQTSFR